MSYSTKTYSGDGVTKLFTVTFPYIDPSHVNVTVDGSVVPYTFQSPAVIEFATPPGMGAVVRLARNSNPSARLVDFQDDSMGTEALFNLNSDQLLYLTQEAIDKIMADTVVAQVQALVDAAIIAADAAGASASSITLPLPVSSGGTGSINPGSARTALGLGTAATQNVGTVEGDVVAVQPGGKLPVLDGSALTGIRKIVQDFPGLITTSSTGTVLIPFDDTIPQITEGWLASTRVITPTEIGTKIIVEVLVNLSSSVAGVVTAALFQDIAPDAVATEGTTVAAAALTQVPLRYEMTVTSLTPITFYLRVGASAAGTLTLNGVGGTRRFGGAMVSYMRVTEVKV
jgi:hypothetical protein